MPKGPPESNSRKINFLQFFTYNSKTIKHFWNRFFASYRTFKELKNGVYFFSTQKFLRGAKSKKPVFGHFFDHILSYNSSLTLWILWKRCASNVFLPTKKFWTPRATSKNRWKGVKIVFEIEKTSKICHFVEFLAYNSKNIKHIWILIITFESKGKNTLNSIRDIPPTKMYSSKFDWIMKQRMQ